MRPEFYSQATAFRSSQSRLMPLVGIRALRFTLDKISADSRGARSKRAGKGVFLALGTSEKTGDCLVEGQTKQRQQNSLLYPNAIQVGKPQHKSTDGSGEAEEAEGWSRASFPRLPRSFSQKHGLPSPQTQGQTGRQAPHPNP